MKKNKILYLVSLVFLLFSCNKDEGTKPEDYKDVKFVKIDSVHSNYSVISMLDTFKIKPTLTGLEDDMELEYLWTMYPSINKEDEDKTMVDTICRTRDLAYFVNKPSGVYKINYQVFHKKRGNVMKYVSFNLNVGTMFSEGFYILKETSSGNTDIDFRSSKGIEMNNLISEMTGSAMTGKPISFGYFPSYFYLNTESNEIELDKFLIPITTDDFRMFRISDMKQIRTFNQMFYGDITQEKPLFCYPGYYSYNFIMENNFYKSSQYQSRWGDSKSGGMLGMPGVLDDDGYELSNYSYITNSYAYFFDKKNNRIVKIDHNGDISTIYDQDSKFKTSNIDYKFLFIGGSDDDEGLALFKDNDSETTFLYHIDFAGANLIDTIYSLPLDYKISKATIYHACKQSKGTVLYVVNNEVYKYSDISHNETKVSVSGLPSDEEITFMDEMKIDTEETKFDYLMIGTYKAGNYKIYMYKTLAGIPLGEPEKVLSGEGKMYKIQYTNSELSNKDSDRSKFTVMY